MIRSPDEKGGQPGRFVWALVLLIVAGSLDAVGFIWLNGLFVSFMSGNTTGAAVRLASGQVGPGLHLLLVIGCFVAGVTLGDVTAGEPPRRAWLVLLAEALLLAGATQFGSAAAGPLLAFTMGAHNALALRAEHIGLALTYVTGTLVHLGRGIAARIARRASPPPVWPYAAMWVALAFGGLVGGVGARWSVDGTLYMLCGVLAVLGLFAAIRAWQQS